MFANVEITAEKDGKKVVRYYTVKLYSGITNKFHDLFAAAGYEKINVRII